MTDIKKQKTYIKYCGLKTVVDLLCASECMIDYVGLMFYKQSPRYISFTQAYTILEEARKLRKDAFFPKIVGVFVDNSFHEIQNTIKLLNLDRVQLYAHYSEHMQYSVPFWSSIRIREEHDLAFLAKLTNDSILPHTNTFEHDVQRELQGMSTKQLLSSATLVIDSYNPNIYGGTGKSFAWDMLNSYQIAKPYFIAGGITIDNVATLLSHNAPCGIDISSGIEKTRGIKDHRLMREMATIVQSNTTDTNTTTIQYKE